MGASDFAKLPHIGEALKRKEDYRFLTGAGQYTDDVNLANQSHAVFLRSPHAHAAIKSIDTAAASKMPGVVGIFTGKDIDGKMGGLPCGWLINNPDGTPMKEPPHPILAIGKVRYVGDHVAMVVADTVEQAKNAAEAIEVDYDVLPALVSVADAAKKAGGVTLHDAAPDNQCYKWALGDKAQVDAVFAKAAHVTKLDLVNNRLIPNAMEPRVAIGSYNRANEEYTLYVANQNPHVERLLMTAFVLGLPEHKVRVIAPDVGGGFGSKIFLYAEDVALTWAAKQLNRSIKWTGERSECLPVRRARPRPREPCRDGDGQGRQVPRAARAHRRQPGRLPVDLLDRGADHPLRHAAGGPVHHAADLRRGRCLVHQHRAGRCLPRRGPARGDLPAGAPGLALRLGNEPGPGRDPQAQLHHPVPLPDAGRAAVRHGRLPRLHGQGEGRWPRWPASRERKKATEAKGKLRGIGYSSYIEACGIAPSNIAGALGARAGLFECGEIRVHPTGSVTVFTGSHSHGQGHETTFAQVVAARLGIPVENVDVVHGDTGRVPFGMGTYGSRSISVGGAAIMKALDKIETKAKKIAAHLMEASDADVEFANGEFTVKGTDKKIPFGQVALTAYVPHNYPLDKLEPGLNETAFYDPTNFTFPGGTYICEVEVDKETGEVKIDRFTAVDDFGTIINPMIVEGQVHGGIVQGMGQALMENCVYDKESGQLLTGSFMDYAMPRADDFPMFKLDTTCTPCTHNPLGTKGCGEAGAIGSPPALINAVLDALAPLGVKDFDMPASPHRVWEAIQKGSVSPTQEPQQPP